jgi:serine/threonine-protein kinase
MTENAEAQAEGPEVPDELAQPGVVIDAKFRIERVVGRGAMATVLEATHLQLDDRVALKLLLPKWADAAELVERFMREGRAATRIRSEHVVRVFDVGVAGTRPYLVMEYLDGKDLDRLIEADGPMPIALAIDYLLQACEAIAEAHTAGVVHRDLKPANLFLTHRADGSPCVKVLDFGISKTAPGGARPDQRTTEPAAFLGSPHYMSPEQMISSTAVDARSDLWALGAILHELIAGAPPFEGETFAALSASVLRDPPPPLHTLRADVPPGLDAAVLRCLEKDPARRFGDVAQLADALAPFGTPAARASADRIARVLDPSGDKGTAPVPSVTEPRVPRAADLVEPPPTSPRSRVFGYLVAGVAFVGIVSWIGWMVFRDEHAQPTAEPTPPVLTTTSAGSAGAAPPASAPPSAVASAPAPPAVSGVPSAPPSAIASAAPSVRPPPHARGPRRGPTPHRPPPLPDFPVPTAETNGEAPLPPSPPVAPLAPSGR